MKLLKKFITIISLLPLVIVSTLYLIFFLLYLIPYIFFYKEESKILIAEFKKQLNK
jgi:hypothetical protein